MLLTEEISKYLIEHEVEVSISFDGSNAVVFENIRRGSNFKIVCRNIERIAAIAVKMEAFQAPGIGISIQRDNWADLVNIIKISNEMGIRRVSMWLVAELQQCRLVMGKEVVEKIAEAIEFAEEKGMAVDLYPTRLGEYIWNGEKYIKLNNSLIDMKCNAPFTCTGINWEGDVYLCCNYGDKVENINGKSFQEIWKGKNYQRLRREVNDFKTMTERCRHCFWVNRY
jgi:radical SAM protein with 4Fe4S-binding SPASM domain